MYQFGFVKDGEGVEELGSEDFNQLGAQATE